MKKVLMTMILTSVSLAPAMSRAEQVKEFTQYLGNQVESTSNAVIQCSAGDTAAASDEDWYFRNFWIRIRPEFGFAVPGLTKFIVVPEIEMLFQRPFADGWTAYKPTN